MLRLDRSLLGYIVHPCSLASLFGHVQRQLQLFFRSSRPALWGETIILLDGRRLDAMIFRVFFGLFSIFTQSLSKPPRAMKAALPFFILRACLCPCTTFVFLLSRGLPIVILR